jgi:hypothetical protein
VLLHGWQFRLSSGLVRCADLAVCLGGTNLPEQGLDESSAEHELAVPVVVMPTINPMIGVVNALSEL